MNVLALAALTLVLMGTAAAFGAPRSHAAPAQTSADPWEGSSFSSPSSYATTTDAVFSGVFRHTPAAPISKVTLHVEFSATDSPASGCRPAPSDQTMTYPTSSTPTSVDPSPEPPDPSTPTTEQPKQSSDVQFSFQVPFTCNGVYDATATAFIEDPTGDVPPPLNKSLSLVAVRVAVAPPTPASISATDAGNHTVNVTWAAPVGYTGRSTPPPDFLGYRVSRKEGAGSFAAIANTAPDVLTFADTSIPESGGAFIYEVEAVRRFASSAPLETNGRLDIAPPSAGGSRGGTRSTGAVGGGGAPASTATDPGAGGTGTAFYDSLADEGPEPGGNALGSGGAVQRFSGGHDGAGLLTPAAAALNLGVWAGLLLFLTRRAAKAERAALLGVDLEHSP